MPPDSKDGEPCLADLLRAVARDVGLDVSVKVEPNLVAGAATGDRTVFVAERRFGLREAFRLAVHEVLGHLTSAANGRAQSLSILDSGTAESFADQEGVALSIEAAYGVLDDGRVCSLAGRVLATTFMHEGASFGETARALHHDHGFSLSETIAITERAYRGGGVARDVGYLQGFLRVQSALREGRATAAELRMGRVSVRSLPAIRELARYGLVRPPAYLANLSRRFFSTNSGTIPCKSPPRAAASLISDELTKK